MSGSPNTNERVNRLLDMLVEEVSLVDRAANKRRFLIVKRSEGMDQDNNGSQPEGDDAQLDAPADTGKDKGNNAGEEHGGDAKDGDRGSVENGALAVAVTALEGLTEAVESLSEMGEADAKAQLGDLAGQFREMAERLSPAASSQEEGQEGSAPPEKIQGGGSQETSASGGAPKSASSDEKSEELLRTLDSLKASLQPLMPLVAALQANPTPPQGTAPTPETPTRKADHLDKLGDQLDLLTSATNTLVGMFKAQNQRLSQVEKRFGLPNSTPPGEGAPGPSGGSEASWPFDINTPVDRGSVDESMSFHEA